MSVSNGNDPALPISLCYSVTHAHKSCNKGQKQLQPKFHLSNLCSVCCFFCAKFYITAPAYGVLSTGRWQWHMGQYVTGDKHSVHLWESNWLFQFCLILSQLPEASKPWVMSMQQCNKKKKRNVTMKNPA